ncbi:hypothetical protein DSO57_1004145 [Entomophthora muscae]|uniref:Uncharacterized protein n=1 Tax=Entomophthora muscae TaxID=34485 RepID=A0ACC2UHW4_9FUNG|nr:hypothetical protein DSO57_1004145 [Entomophthora muscae]
MFKRSPSGFYNAPVTKSILIGTVSISLLTSILNWKKYLHLQLFPHVVSQHQFWRLFVSQLAFTRSGEVLLGSLLIYQARLLERLYGSAKYASFLLLSLALSTAIQCLTLAAGRSYLKAIPPGPYAVIFSALFQYYRMVPAVYSFKIGKIPVGDKAAVYILAFQLILSRSPMSLIASISGLIVGTLYNANIGGVKRWRIPIFFSRLCSQYIFPLVKSMPPARSNLPSRPGRASPSSEPSTPTPEANPATVVRETFSSTLTEDTLGTDPVQVEELQHMFEHLPREVIVRVLAISNNDLNAAAAALLEVST